MFVVNEEGSRPIKVWLKGQDDIESQALTQLKNLARLPFIAKNGVAAMPDCHAGKGSTVGSVIATTKAIIPAAVGVDIGCGMVAVRTSLTANDLPESTLGIRMQIERDVPLGAGGKYGRDLELEGNWAGRNALKGRIEALLNKHPDLRQTKKGQEISVDDHSVWAQLGSLGSGNHFIELCLDQDQNVWIMLHSGSRGFGNKIGTRFIEMAMEDMQRYFIDLPDRDLAYLPEGTAAFNDYIAAVAIGQEYAYQNRAVMLERVIAAMRRTIAKPFTLTDEAINCHHNYVEMENHFGQNMWITRKGAIQARKGSLGIIPGSMGQKSYIVCGKGHHESYCSCSHGAGRVYSRTKAKEIFTVEDLKAQTMGVECDKTDAVLDEIPGAYKPIDEVMKNQSDLVEVVHTLKQFLCVKGK
jgi:tRNA-splicing ligase RtcB